MPVKVTNGKPTFAHGCKEIGQHACGPSAERVLCDVDRLAGESICHPTSRVCSRKRISRRTEPERVQYVVLDVARERRVVREERGRQVREDAVHDVGVLEGLSEAGGGFQILQPLDLGAMLKKNLLGYGMKTYQGRDGVVEHEVAEVVTRHPSPVAHKIGNCAL